MFSKIVINGQTRNARTEEERQEHPAVTITAVIRKGGILKE